MAFPLRRIVVITLLATAALVLGSLALVVLPVYGAVMVIWMHVPLMKILLTIGPLVLACGIGAYAALRAIVRAWKTSHDVLGSAPASQETPRK